MQFTTIIETPLGEMLAVAEPAGVGGLWFFGQRYFPAAWEHLPRQDEAEIACLLRGQLNDYFTGCRREFTVPLVPEGSRFRQLVWAHLQRIPAGTTVTYGELARQLNLAGASTSPRAVGGAVGHNPISILIPCHRVVGAGGSLTGYAGGLARKEALLRLESAG